MKKTISLIFVILLGLSVVAQTPTENIAKVLKQYKSLNKVSINLQYYYYTSHSSKKVSEEASGVYQKNGDKLRVKQYGTEFIQNDKYLIVIDDSSRAVVLTNAQKNNDAAFNIEQILANYEKIKSISSKKSRQKAYHIFFKTGASSEYESAKIYINEKNNLIDEVVLYYSKAYDVSPDPKVIKYQKPKLRIVYTKIDTSPVFSKGTFNVSKYVNFNLKGKNTLKTKYSLYEFYDQTK